MCFKKCKNKNDFVLVIQDDATFASEEELLKGINLAERFMSQNKEVDIFMLSYHPKIFSKTKNPEIIKINSAIHWQSVVFRKSLFEKYPTIPYGFHSDKYIL